MESTTESKRKVSPKYVRSTNYNKSKINRQKEKNQIVNQTNHDEFAKNTKEWITMRQEFTDQQNVDCLSLASRTYVYQEIYDFCGFPNYHEMTKEFC